MRKIFIIGFLAFSCQNKPKTIISNDYTELWKIMPDSLKESLSRKYFIDNYKSTTGKMIINCSIWPNDNNNTYNNKGNYMNGSDLAINPESGAVDLNDSLPAGL